MIRKPPSSEKGQVLVHVGLVMAVFVSLSGIFIKTDFISARSSNRIDQNFPTSHSGEPVVQQTTYNQITDGLSIPAFPGAQGFGAESKGGRGGMNLSSN